jgi:hypothetical protein
VQRASFEVAEIARPGVEYYNTLSLHRFLGSRASALDNVMGISDCERCLGPSQFDLAIEFGSEAMYYSPFKNPRGLNIICTKFGYLKLHPN